ncbi:MAG: hypothetical protein AB7K64_08615 [Variibacter sp.]
MMFFVAYIGAPPTIGSAKAGAAKAAVATTRAAAAMREECFDIELSPMCLMKRRRCSGAALIDPARALSRALERAPRDPSMQRVTGVRSFGFARVNTLS